MDNVYYNSTRIEILKKLKCLNESKYVDFLEESLPFLLSMYIAYFGLAEDIMIERDSKNFDINTRFTKHIDEENLKELFPANIPIDIIKKEANGNSMEWFLSTLRNSLFHNGLEVDYHNQTLKISNCSFLNTLECNIPFSWFENFMNKNIVEKVQLEDYTHYVFNAPFIPVGKTPIIDNYDDINNFINDRIHGIVINIKLDSSKENPAKVERPNFIYFVETVSAGLFSAFYDTHEKNEKIEEIKKKVEDNLKQEKASLSEFEYEKLVYFNTFKEVFTEKFHSEFPDYNISFSQFQNNQYAESLFIRGRDRVNFFKHEHPAFKGQKISELLYEKFNHDKIEYLSKIYDLYSMYKTHSPSVTKEFKTDKYMEKVVNARKHTNFQELEFRFMETIKEELEKRGVILSYDNMITESLKWGMKIYDDEVHTRCRKLTEEYQGLLYTPDYYKYIMDNIKLEFPNYYDEKKEEYIKKGVPADQVWEAFCTHNLYSINNAKTLIKNERYHFIEALLYLMGINTYVMNKETYFKDFTDADYSFMNSYYFKGYSHDLYKTNIAVVKQKKSDLKKKEKRITESLKGLTIGISKTSDSKELERKREDLKDQTEQLNNISAEISKCDNIINSTDVITFGNVQLQKVSNSLCATIIRNCFAHCDRIHITGIQNGETMITLTDYDTNGEISGIVQTDLTSLITFLSHDIFKNEMNKNEGNHIKQYKK